MVNRLRSKQNLPDTVPLPEGIRDDLFSRFGVTTYDAGTTIFRPDRKTDEFLLLLEGAIRVQHRSETGREVTLFRAAAGDGCVMLQMVLLGGEDVAAEGLAETAVKAIAIPRQAFDDLLVASADFRTFVLQAYSKRITDLLMLVEGLTSHRLDTRLASLLLDRAGSETTLKTTHLKLAAELGTAREVVSRTLAEFQRRGWITQARGQVHLQNPSALHRQARAQP